MAKSSKRSKEEAAPTTNPAASGNEAQNGAGAAVSKSGGIAKRTSAKTAKSTPSIKPKLKRRGAPVTQKATGSKPRTTEVGNEPAPAEAAISDEEIRLRAYFISQWRVQNGITGDSGNDWLEARRQLLAEAVRRA